MKLYVVITSDDAHTNVPTQPMYTRAWLADYKAYRTAVFSEEIPTPPEWMNDDRGEFWAARYMDVWVWEREVRP